ncbi:hypothetical protein M23134_07054 [Microscilla marina ATCC 23134]|uniref:Uncharacterized protein n=1 Tax=Microscilla marina ATCC 23134 TaxID=313606 RepID=A1ZT68_MICM2|nr:hypothetical protein M23134_07054 [Microscilla marina ATCC 23134]
MLSFSYFDNCIACYTAFNQKSIGTEKKEASACSKPAKKTKSPELGSGDLELC